MNDLNPSLLPSLVRTLVPMVIGPLVTRYLPWVDLKDPNVVLVTSAVAAYAYYVIVRLLEMKAPKLGWLLGIAKQPAYADQPAPAPDVNEHLEAQVVPDVPVVNDPVVDPGNPPVVVDDGQDPLWNDPGAPQR